MCLYLIYIFFLDVSMCLLDNHMRNKTTAVASPPLNTPLYLETSVKNYKTKQSPTKTLFTQRFDLTLNFEF